MEALNELPTTIAILGVLWQLAVICEVLRDIADQLRRQ
jgi:hypothetical protein